MNSYLFKKYILIHIIILATILFSSQEKLIPYPYSNHADNSYNIDEGENGDKNINQIQVSEDDYTNPSENQNENNINEKPYNYDEENELPKNSQERDQSKVSDQILIDPNQNLDLISDFKVHDNYNSLSKSVDTSLKIDTKKDIYWEFGATGDYVDLIIRKKPKINSIMLTNMYYGNAIQLYGNKVYGLRSKKEFKINQKEKRIIGNKMIDNTRLLFLVDSNPEKNYIFKEAFRVRLSLQVEYGYKAPGENYGIIFIKKGVVINLRTFSDKYANHAKSFENNPIEIDFSEKDYLKRMKPNLTKLSVYNSNSYKIIKIKYFSRFDYIKYFLIRDIHKSQFFKKISFSKEPFKNNTGLVIRAMNQPEHGITMIALIYIKEENYEKDYEIAAVDQQNRISQNIIRFTNDPIIKNDPNPYKKQKKYENFEKSEDSILQELIK